TGDRAVGPEVRAERVAGHAELLGPRLQGIDRVARDAHDLGRPRLVSLLERRERRSFMVSGPAEREGHERADDPLTAEGRERDRAPVVRAEREVGRRVADLERLRLGRDLRPTLRSLLGHVPTIARVQARGAEGRRITARRRDFLAYATVC